VQLRIQSTMLYIFFKYYAYICNCKCSALILEGSLRKKNICHIRQKRKLLSFPIDFCSLLFYYFGCFTMVYITMQSVSSQTSANWLHFGKSLRWTGFLYRQWEMITILFSVLYDIYFFFLRLTSRIRALHLQLQIYV
jgi:hypothetical protein